MTKTAMILAAGRGDRMRPLTDHCPKPLLKVGRYSLIEHQILRLRDAGFERVVINHAWLGEQIECVLGDGSALGVHILYSAESEALETAGGIVQALEYLQPGPVLIVNGDVWTDMPYRDIALPESSLAHLVLVPNPEHHPTGDFVLDAQTHSVHLPESMPESMPDASSGAARVGDRYTFSGVAYYDLKLFADLAPGKRPLLDVLRPAIASGRVTGALYEGAWVDVGTPDRLRQLQAQHAAQQ